MTLLETLKSAYGTRTALRDNRPVLDSVIAAILSQSTTAVHAARAMADLKTRFRDWGEVRRAEQSQIVAAIHSAGLANIKATRIQQLLEHVYSHLGRTSLEFFREVSPARARELLLELPGVGPKSAAHVMTFVLGCPDIPVGTHVLRVVRRLGWIGERAPASAAYKMLRNQVPDRVASELHLLLLAHGRGTCLAKRPKCTTCPVRTSCAARIDDEESI
jgi:endonuclease-3